MQTEFGKTSDGEVVYRVVLKRDQLTVGIITFGAAIQSILFPDKEGHLSDVVLGYDNVADYETNNPYLGVIVGRVTGRIKNGMFIVPAELGGEGDHQVQLPQNNGPNCLHGGIKGLSRRLWSLKEVSEHSASLMIKVKDGEEGFPGDMDISITYTLEPENRVRLDYKATVSKVCPVNLTNHSYFNLAGEGTANIYDHVVSIAGNLTPTLGEDLLPTGMLVSLPTSLQTPGALLSRELLNKTGNCEPFGFDSYIIFESVGLDECQGQVRHDPTGRVLQLYTDQLGVQFYTGNFLNGEKGKNGHIYGQHSGFCLETQGFPDAVNNPDFPSIWLHPGEIYSQTTIYQFSVASD